MSGLSYSRHEPRRITAAFPQYPNMLECANLLILKDWGDGKRLGGVPAQTGFPNDAQQLAANGGASGSERAADAGPEGISVAGQTGRNRAWNRLPSKNTSNAARIGAIAMGPGRSPSTDAGIPVWQPTAEELAALGPAGRRFLEAVLEDPPTTCWLGRCCSRRRIPWTR